MDTTLTPRTFAVRPHELPAALAIVYRAELRVARRPDGRAARTRLALRAGAAGVALAATGAAMAHGHTPEAFLGIATALLITAAPLALTILPGWNTWMTTDRRGVTITDPHAASVRTWALDAPAPSILENTLAEHLDHHAPAKWTAPADLHRITEPWAPLR
ncbi:hypothetical protein AB0333_16005 [Citricoccus sp. NPDC079358]|uniref:hypothetical protein n=1 Tax=Citricoccus sp. NPDC079358 TaxID=3154653 RepID=UPI00344E8D4C